MYNFMPINHNQQKKNQINSSEENTENEDNTICIYWHPTPDEILLLHAIELFPKIHQHGEKWKDSAEFRAQSLKFVQTITMCIELLDKMDIMAEKLRLIGERHVQYAKRGFKPIYWDIFYDALKFSLFEHMSSFIEFDDQKRHDIINVWSKLAHYIITQMKRGYCMGRKTSKFFN
uniref:Globin family profile domain-containing protein n=1 Tax=Acrobeloides nanus TaxID=290746 RepID=A0A914DVK8_9BILA